VKKKGSNQNYFNYILDITSDFVINVIQKVNKLLTSKNKGGLVKSIIRIACCLLLLSLLRIPFEIIGKTIYGILYLWNLPFNKLILGGWNFTYQLLYLIMTLIILMKAVLDRSNRKEFSFEIKASKEKCKELYNTVYTVLKIITVISLIPLVLLWGLLFAFLGMLLAFFANGIYFFGPVLIVIGFIIIFSHLLLFLYDIIFESKEAKK